MNCFTLSPDYTLGSAFHALAHVIFTGHWLCILQSNICMWAIDHTCHLLFKYTYIQHYVHVYIRMYVRTIMYTCTAHIVSIRTCSKGILRFCFKATSRHRHRYMLLHYCVCRVMYACWHVLHVPCKPYGGEVSPA